MPNRRAVVTGGLALAAVGCAPMAQPYTGPEVTRIVINKGARRMLLLNQQTVLKAYDVDLGFQPRGHKVIEGDGKTPEGSYVIDRKNPESLFYLSLGISYPNEQDIAQAAALGEDPGGDIFIHGASGRLGTRGTDWTFGCIAVSNREITDIFGMVNVGTQVDLFA